jgi:hypothetical protein
MEIMMKPEVAGAVSVILAVVSSHELKLEPAAPIPAGITGVFVVEGDPAPVIGSVVELGDAVGLITGADIEASYFFNCLALQGMKLLIRRF